MPRSRRLIPDWSVQHIIARFVAGEFFFETPGARGFYLARLGAALKTHDARVFCYSLMSNHLHLGVRVGRLPFSRVISSTHTAFSLWLNKQLPRIGPVFAGRFKNVSFEPEKAGELVAYIHNNSTRAGVNESPADCRWSSHRAYLGDTQPPQWLDVACGLELSGFGLDPSGRLGLADFVESRKHNPRDASLVGEVTKPGRPPRIRGATVRMSPRLERSSILRWPLATTSGGSRCTPWTGTVATAVDVAAALCGLPPSELRLEGRRRRASAARDALLLSWADYLGRPAHEIAAALGLTSSAASHGARRARARSPSVEKAMGIAEVCRTGPARVSRGATFGT